MATGIQVWDDTSNLVFDSNLAVGGYLTDVVLGSTSTQVKSYPEYAGKTAVVQAVFGSANPVPTISYASGYPVVTIPAYGTVGAVAWAIIMT